MSYSINIQIISLLQIFHILIDPSVTSIAVTRNPASFVHKFYQKERNKNPPVESDPTITDASAWLRVCEEVSACGVFELFDGQPIDRRKMYRKQKWLSKHRSLYVLHRFALVDYDHESAFRAAPRLEQVEEYVFGCPLKFKGTRAPTCFYVSKAYSIQSDLRFVFFRNRRQSQFSQLIFIEKSAEPYLRSDFNVELHYLELRKHRQSVEEHDLDPVCKLRSAQVQNHQGYRLCSAVLSSAHFKDAVKRPYEAFPIGCQREKVSFRNLKGQDAATEKSYFELMIRCSTISIDGEANRLFLISRAYNPNEVFVYTALSNGNIYIEALSFNVNIVHELHRFGNAET